MEGDAVCTILSVKPYSGFYLACTECLGKVNGIENEGTYWCRKCSTRITPSDVKHQYCIALTVTDQSCICVDVVLFGKTCETIFGCSAAQLNRLLNTHNGDLERSYLLTEALSLTLVAKCCVLSFNTSTKSLHSRSLHCPSLSDIVSLNKQLTSSGGYKKGLKLNVVATRIMLLGSGEKDTVVSKLFHRYGDVLEPSPAGNQYVYLHGNSGCEELYDQSNSQEDTTHASLPGQFSDGVSPLHQGSLLLESFTKDSQNTTQLSKSLENCDRGQMDDRLLPNQQSMFETSDLQSIVSSSSVLRSVANGSKCSNLIHSWDKECLEHVAELVRNSNLIQELESDWESSQVERDLKLSKQYSFLNQSSCLPSPYKHTCFLCEKCSSELMGPFSQSSSLSHECVRIQKSPHATDQQHEYVESGFTVVPSSTPMLAVNSSGISDSLSPELFSSASSLYHSGARLRAGFVTNQSQTQLVEGSCASPELFGSTLKNSSDRNTVSEHIPVEQSQCHSTDYQTPALSFRTKSRVPRRKLVQGENCGMLKDSQLAPLSQSKDCPTSPSASHNLQLLKDDYRMYTATGVCPDLNFSPDLF